MKEKRQIHAKFHKGDHVYVAHGFGEGSTGIIVGDISDPLGDRPSRHEYMIKLDKVCGPWKTGSCVPFFGFELARID